MLNRLKKKLCWGIAKVQEKENSSSVVNMAVTVDVSEILRRQGNEYLKSGNLEKSIASYRQALAVAPAQFENLICLGYALLEQGGLKESETVLKRAALARPHSADARFMLGCIAKRQGDDAGVVREMGAALDIDPTFLRAYPDLCLALFRLGQSARAHQVVAQGLALFPDDAQLYFYQGNLFAESGAYEAGAASFERVLSLQADHAQAWANLGNCQRHLGFVGEAITSLRRAIELNPGQADWHSNLLLSLQYQGGLSRQQLYDEHLRFAELYEKPLQSYRRSEVMPRQNGKLRIGYVSGDFRNHSIAFFIEPVLRHHDRTEVEVFCYYTFPVHDAVTARLQGLTDHWRSCADLSDDDLAQRIRDDRIDVLIDLSGHTGHNRLLVFARKPAPVQMTWLGYMSTTGLSSMDYRITDAALDPPGSSEAFHSERLLRIESSACFQPAAESPEVNPLPALDGRPFTFGSLNNPAKITPAAIDAWAAILRGTPASRLVIAGLPERVQAQMKEQFGSRGIGAERIRLVAPLPLGEFLRLHHEIDLALDTFPYNGGTTSLHAMWMGVPVVSLAGVLPVERAGVSMLGGFGIPQFAAFDWEQYVAVAVRAAEDLESLNAVRQSLRDRMGSVMVRQAAGMTKSLEAALKTTFKASLDRANLEDSH